MSAVGTTYFSISNIPSLTGFWKRCGGNCYQYFIPDGII